MTGFALPVQFAIFNRLNSELATPVFDDLPQTPEGFPESGFPFVVIGDDVLTPWDRDDKVGAEVVVSIHIYSRYQGKKEVKEIAQAIFTALNRQADNLSAAGYRFVDCLHDTSNFIEFGDGKTEHGIVRYLVTVEEA